MLTHIFKVHLQLHRIYIFKIQGNGNLDHKIVPCIFYSLQTTSSSMSFFIMLIVQGSDWRKYRGKGTTFHDRNYGATASKEHRRDPSTVYRSIWPSCHWSQILGGSIWHGLFHKGFVIIWDLQTNLDVLVDLVWCEVGRRKLFDINTIIILL